MCCSSCSSICLEVILTGMRNAAIWQPALVCFFSYAIDYCMRSSGRLRSREDHLAALYVT